MYAFPMFSFTKANEFLQLECMVKLAIQPNFTEKRTMYLTHLTLHRITLRYTFCVTLHYTSFRYKIRYVICFVLRTLHYVTLQYVTLHVLL